MKKKVILNTERELIRFLNSNGIAKRLKFLARTLMLDDEKRRKFSFKFNFKTGSYTDGKDIYVGVPEYSVGHTREEVFVFLKALTAHEVEHINSSSFELMKTFIEDFAKYFKDTYDIDERVSKKVAAYINNCIEDGRIERISSHRTPGLKKSFFYHRTTWWINNDVLKSENDNFLFDTLFAFCTIATMGQYPLNYLTKYDEEHPEAKTLIKSWEKYIYKCVDDDNVEHYFENLWKLIKVMEDWLVEQMKKAEEDANFEDAMDSLISDSGIGELSDETHGDSSGSPSGKTPKRVSSPVEDKEDENEEEGNGAGTGEENEEENEEEGNGAGTGEENEEEEEEGKAEGEGEDDTLEGDDKTDDSNSSEDLRDMFDPTKNYGEGDSGDMLDVVKEAMKNAEEEILKDEGDTLIQAELEDKKEKEKEEKESSGITKKEIDEIEEAYDKKRWDTTLKIYKQKFPLVKISSEGQLEAKKIKKEFEKIFLNKVSRNVSNKRKGILDTKKLHRVIQNDNKVFMKKGNPNQTDYAFYLLIDGSGSMFGNKFVEAYKAASILEECLKEIAPLKVVQFDCRYKTVNHYIVKDFNDNKPNVNYSTTFALNSQANNCNMDGFSIRVATQELIKRNEKRKVLIILSDGCPNGDSHFSYSGKDAQSDVKDAIRHTRKNGINVFNIMFGSKGDREYLIPIFKYMYEKGIVNCDPKNITSSLLKIVKKELVK